MEAGRPARHGKGCEGGDELALALGVRGEYVGGWGRLCRELVAMSRSRSCSHGRWAMLLEGRPCCHLQPAQWRYGPGRRQLSRQFGSPVSCLRAYIREAGDASYGARHGGGKAAPAGLLSRGWLDQDGRARHPGAGEEGSDSTAEPRAAQTHARMHCPSPAAVDIEGTVLLKYYIVQVPGCRKRASHPAPRHGRRIREGGPPMPCHATDRADDETGSSNKSSSRRARVRASATGGGAGEIALGLAGWLAGCCASPADEEARNEPPSSGLRTVM